jgi:hypothetical protein
MAIASCLQRHMLLRKFSAALIAAAVTVEFCILTGAGNLLTHGYSTDVSYRRQTDALLRGHIALSNSLKDLRFDMAWVEGAVQQVWGLGVPLWRTPFEVCARLGGWRSFPDQIAFAIAFFVIAYAAIRSFLLSTNVKRPWLRTEREFTQPGRILATLMLLFFPPFLNLCSGRFEVYEEAVAYGYLFAVGLFLALRRFAHECSLANFLFVAAISGIAGFVRPTLAAYGTATFAIAGIIAWRTRISLPQKVAGLALFGCGLSALWISNFCRFGAGFEFGHHLNLSSADIMYAARFGSPLDATSSWLQLSELFGALFRTDWLTDIDAMDNHVSPWQLDVPRRRDFYFTTYDISFLLVVLCGWIASLVVMYKKRPRFAEALKQELCLSAAWSGCSIPPLLLFYASYYPISSRYLVDFAPAFAAVFVGVILTIHDIDGYKKARRIAEYVLLSGFLLWWLVQLSAAERMFSRAPGITAAEAVSRVNNPETLDAVLPAQYYLPGGPSPAATGILFNGFGWNEQTSQTSSLVVLFIPNARFIHLNVEPDNFSNADIEKELCLRIQARLGLATLTATSVVATPTGRCVTFTNPSVAGLDPTPCALFLAMSPRDNFLDELSPTDTRHLGVVVGAFGRYSAFAFISWRENFAVACRQRPEERDR